MRVSDQESFKWLCGAPKVTGREVERLVGHATFHFLACRGLLSIFSSIYVFIHDLRYTWSRHVRYTHCNRLLLLTKGNIRPHVLEVTL